MWYSLYIKIQDATDNFIFWLSDVWGRVSLWATDNQNLFVIICILIIFFILFWYCAFTCTEKDFERAKKTWEETYGKYGRPKHFHGNIFSP